MKKKQKRLNKVRFYVLVVFQGHVSHGSCLEGKIFGFVKDSLILHLENASYDVVMVDLQGVSYFKILFGC